MYARFLEETGYEESDLAAQASERWTELAEGARLASESEKPDAEMWRGLGAAARAVLEAEEPLWGSLAG
jgi:hypothetical protein